MSCYIYVRGCAALASIVYASPATDHARGRKRDVDTFLLYALVFDATQANHSRTLKNISLQNNPVMCLQRALARYMRLPHITGCGNISCNNSHYCSFEQ